VVGGVSLANFTLAVPPAGITWSLSNTVDPGFIDLVVNHRPANLTWNNTGGTGTGTLWDTAGQQNWNNGSGPALFNTADNVTFNDTNTVTTPSR